MIDFDTQLYDQQYAVFGAPAVITLANTGGDQTLTVIDQTTGIAVPVQSGQQTEIQSIRPVAWVRMRELNEKGIALEDLHDAELTIDPGESDDELEDVVWRVRSHQARPEGGGSGEVMLILAKE